MMKLTKLTIAILLAVASIATAAPPGAVDFSRGVVTRP